MILIAIGANLPGPDGASALDSCRAAVKTVSELADLRLRAVSHWYESAPVPPSGQPNYVNGVAFFERAAGSDITPENLLAALHAVESRFGRRRAEVNGARTLDLDLIDMEGLVRAAPDPVLPHPGAHLRAFVLRPLLDVAPNWIHPGNGLAGASLLVAAGNQAVRLIAA